MSNKTMEKYQVLAKMARSIAAWVDDGMTYDEAVIFILEGMGPAVKLTKDGEPTLQIWTKLTPEEIADAYDTFMRVNKGNPQLKE